MWWNVKREGDGGFIIWVDGDEARPLRALSGQLARQLTPSGVDVEEILAQLAKAETARVLVPKVGHFSQAG